MAGRLLFVCLTRPPAHCCCAACSIACAAQGKEFEMDEARAICAFAEMFSRHLEHSHLQALQVRPLFYCRSLQHKLLSAAMFLGNYLKNGFVPVSRQI